MCNGRIPVGGVGARPKQQVTRAHRVQLEAVEAPADDGMKSARLASPYVLLAGRARNARDSCRLKHEVNGARAIHAAECRIRRSVLISKIFSRQREASLEKRLDGMRAFVKIEQLRRIDARGPSQDRRIFCLLMVWRFREDQSSQSEECSIANRMAISAD